MPVIQAPVIAYSRVTFQCDRCGRKKTADYTEQDLLTGTPEPPAGWRACYHPVDSPQELLFDTRSCMSSWFATFVRVLYGGPEELPKRKRGPRKVSPLRKGTKAAEAS